MHAYRSNHSAPPKRARRSLGKKARRAGAREAFFLRLAAQEAVARILARRGGLLEAILGRRDEKTARYLALGAPDSPLLTPFYKGRPPVNVDLYELVERCREAKESARRRALELPWLPAPEDGRLPAGFWKLVTRQWNARQKEEPPERRRLFSDWRSTWKAYETTKRRLEREARRLCGLAPLGVAHPGHRAPPSERLTKGLTGTSTATRGDPARIRPGETLG